MFHRFVELFLESGRDISRFDGFLFAGLCLPLLLLELFFGSLLGGSAGVQFGFSGSHSGASGFELFLQFDDIGLGFEGLLARFADLFLPDGLGVGEGFFGATVVLLALKSR